MKFIKFFEDYGFEQEIPHQDNELFEEIIKEIGLNLFGEHEMSTKNYWDRNVISNFEIIWTYNDPIMMPSVDSAGKTSYHEMKIGFSKKQYHINNDQNKIEYSVWIYEKNRKLDVSEEIIEKYFNILENKYFKLKKENDKSEKERKTNQIHQAIKQREKIRIEKDSKKFGL